MSLQDERLLRDCEIKRQRLEDENVELKERSKSLESELFQLRFKAQNVTPGIEVALDNMTKAADKMRQEFQAEIFDLKTQRDRLVNELVEGFNKTFIDCTDSKE